jgi:type IV secretion system protein TrbL
VSRRLGGLLTVVALAVASLVAMPAEPAAASDPRCIAAPWLCVAGEVLEAGGEAVGSAASTVLDGAAHAFADAAASVLRETFGWWLRTPSVSIEDSGVLQLQGVILGFSVIVGVLLVTVQGIRMVVTRRGAPLAELVQGLFVAALVTSIGVALVDGALMAGDELALHLLSREFATGDELVERMVGVLFGAAMSGNAGLLFVFALVVVFVGLVQAVLLFLRQAAIPLLALMFPLVAMGQLGPTSTRKWLPTVGATVIAIVLYKPLVALILTAGFSQISQGDSLLDVVRGFVTLILSVVALPAMLRIFTPIVGSVAAGASGGGAALLGAAGSLATVAALRGHGTPGDTDAASHATFMAGRDGGSGPGGSPGSAGQPAGGGGPSSHGTPAESAATQAHHVGANTGSAPAGAPSGSAAAAGSGAVANGAASGAAASGVGVPAAVALKTVEVGRAAGQAAGEQVASGSEAPR